MKRVIVLFTSQSVLQSSLSHRAFYFEVGIGASASALSISFISTAAFLVAVIPFHYIVNNKS
jgi:hypothetical protein